jgi:hypothetical protein
LALEQIEDKEQIAQFNRAYGTGSTVPDPLDFIVGKPGAKNGNRVTGKKTLAIVLDCFVNSAQYLYIQDNVTTE